MRRKDRQITSEETITDILQRAEVIRIGLYDGEEPYIVPMNYGFVKTEKGFEFYMHCAQEGRKIEIIRENPKVCFEIDIDHELKSAPKACGWTMTFKSLMGTGTISILDGNDDKKTGLGIVMDHYNPEGYGKPYDFSGLIDRTTILKLESHSLFCKVKS
ncbi:MAG: pyridoxamine 5'-phosphate oxidase family protein [Bacteroidales bacterium]|nr:pyridoxamine 5'-phosphate oxidase family protein [Bacteroidales bacterium]MBN2819786.1 pyridoxamine 5'-phosphate oxidase family protein [Bacteroidales bacterium]